MRTNGRAKFIIGGAVIIAVVAWLVYSSIGGSSADYMTAAQLITGGPSNRIVRATGLVVGQTIEFDSQRMILRFEIRDDSGSLPVQYKGPQPDMLKDDAQAVVEGKYTASGVFEATSVLLKCPSKYVKE